MLRRTDGSLARLPDELVLADLLINATPVGTGTNDSLVPARWLRPDLAVLDLGDIEDVTIANIDGKTVRLGEVATVTRTHKERTTVTHISGRESVEIAVYKEGDANIVEMARLVRGHLDRLKGQLPEQMKLEVLFDQSVFIAKAVAEVVRVTRRFVIVSTPSKPDDNPQHIHLLDEAKLRELFAAAGVTRVNCDYVLNHVITVANMQAESC